MSIPDCERDTHKTHILFVNPQDTLQLDLKKAKTRILVLIINVFVAIEINAELPHLVKSNFHVCEFASDFSAMNTDVMLPNAWRFVPLRFS